MGFLNHIVWASFGRLCDQPDHHSFSLPAPSGVGPERARFYQKDYQFEGSFKLNAWAISLTIFEPDPALYDVTPFSFVGETAENGVGRIPIPPHAYVWRIEGSVYSERGLATFTNTEMVEFFREALKRAPGLTRGETRQQHQELEALMKRFGMADGETNVVAFPSKRSGLKSLRQNPQAAHHL